MKFQLIQCPKCRKSIPLEALQSDEISSPIGMEEARDMGYIVLTFDNPREAQAMLNRGDCKCEIDTP